MAFIKEMYGMVFILTIVSGLILIVTSNMGEVYNTSNPDLSYLDKSQELQNNSDRLYSSIQDFSGAEGFFSSAFSGVELFTVGLASVLNILMNGVLFIPNVLGNVITELFPTQISSLLVGSVVSFIILLLIFGMIYLIGGRTP